jgi:hypothetical protein
MCSAKRHVRFTPNSGHVQCNSICPLSANSGHLRAYSITPRLTQINAPLLGILFLNMFRDITPAALRGAAMTNQLDQTQRGHLIGDMLVSFIFSSLIVTLPILALLLIMGVRFH